MILLVSSFVLADTELVFHYLADSTTGTTLVNSVGTDGTVSSDAIWNTQGKLNGCLYHNELYFGTTNETMGTLTNYTYCSWFNVDTFGVDAFFSASLAGIWYVYLTNDAENNEIFTRFAGGGQEYITAAKSAGTWYHLCVVNNFTGLRVFQDGVESSTGYTNKGGSSDNSPMYIGQYQDGLNDLKGRQDDIRFYNGSISNETIQLIYNNGAGTQEDYPTETEASPVITITYPSDDDKINNDTEHPLLINGSVSVSYGVANYTWINNTNWKNIGNYVDFNFTMNGTITDGITYYLMVLANNSEGTVRNSTVYFTYDLTSPVGVSSLKGNRSLFYAHQNITFQINVTDNEQVYSLNLSNPEGYSLEITGLNTKKYIYNGSINASTYGIGIHNITAKYCDAHTAKDISDYQTDKDIFNKELIYTTPKKSNIRIKLKDSDLFLTNFDTYKIKDRYVFFFDFGGIEDKFYHTYNFVVEGEGLDYISNSNFPAHFITKYHWIDFNFDGNEDADYTVKKINDNIFEVMIVTKKTFLSFKSIGDLNCNEKTWEYYLFNYTASYSPTGIATETKTFGLTVDFQDIILDGNATLNYNETAHNISSVISSNQINYTINITAPQKTTMLENISFFWTFDLNTSSFTTINYTQTVYSIQLVIHGNLSNASTLNFTLYDEGNSSIISGDITGTFNYDSSTLSIDETGLTNLSIAIYPPSASISGDYVIYYSATNYPERRYTETAASYSNITQVIPLYLLYVADGMYIRFRFVDSYQNPISDVECTMKRTIGGTSVTVEQQTTDDSGLATFWVNPDVDYTFVFVKAGYVSYTTTIRPTTSEIYTITLEAEEEEEEVSYAAGITYTFSPSNIVLNNNTAYDFIFNLTSSYWDITNCTLFLKSTSDTLTRSSSSYTTSRCDILINYNTGNLTYIISEAQYQLNYTINETILVQYKIQYTYEGEFSLKNFVDDLTAFGRAGFSDFTRMVIAFVVIFAIVAYSSSKFALRDPEALIILTWALVLFFSYVGWFTLNYEAIPNVRGLAEGWLKQYIIFILLTLAGGTYIIRRHL